MDTAVTTRWFGDLADRRPDSLVWEVARHVTTWGPGQNLTGLTQDGWLPRLDSNQ